MYGLYGCVRMDHAIAEYPEPEPETEPDTAIATATKPTTAGTAGTAGQRPLPERQADSGLLLYSRMRATVHNPWNAGMAASYLAQILSQSNLTVYRVAIFLISLRSNRTFWDVKNNFKKLAPTFII
jgi:hypothetical protein